MVLSIYQKCSVLCKVKTPKDTDKAFENTLIVTLTMTWGSISREARDNSVSVWVHTWDFPDQKRLSSTNYNLVVWFQDTNYCLLRSKSYKWILFGVQQWYKKGYSIWNVTVLRRLPAPIEKVWKTRTYLYWLY